MKLIYKTACLAIASALVFSACKKTPEVGILDTGEFGETSTPLKDAADFPVGAAISLNHFMNDAQYKTIVQRDFDAVTFEYEMKHGAIVEDNGTLDFSNADALVAAVGNLDIFGHTLGWHQNQNASYLKSFAGIVIPAAAELLANPGLEDGMNNWSIFNSGNPAGTSQITITNVANEVHSGASAMKVVNPTAYPGSQWRVQVASELIATIPGEDYAVSYWVKTASGSGSIRLSTQTSGGGSAQYQGDQTIGTSWQQVTWNITANSPQTRVLFDMGQAAATYFIDDISVKEVLTPPSGAEVSVKLDQALNTFITGMVNRYKNKVKAWDVVNELFADNGDIRNNSNTNITNPDVLVWSNYMGRDFAYKAFQYAAAADPSADLYINDYGLESNSRKLDSLISFVEELQAMGIKIDGIGTQMHVAWNSSYDGIDKMLQNLAATGLKIRISELDVKSILSSAAGKPTPQNMAYQANMIKYVVSSYMKHVPAAQRGGITVWGVTDNTGWLYNSGAEYALLYDENYNKKPAYGAFLQGLNTQ